MGGQYTKIVLAGDDESHLRALKDAAKDANLPQSLVSDAGHTEIEAGTVTTLGIGPAEGETIDKITGDLSLYPRP